MKKILFIGDLRSASNYGAVATTESLIRLLQNEKYDIDIRYIDYRSLYHPTPSNGYKPLSEQSIFLKIKRIIPFKVKKLIRSIQYRNSKPNDFVPYKWTQYEEYYNRMMSDDILQFEKRMLEWADIIYINGEGNIVNGTDRYGKYRMGARYILYMAWLSKMKYAKPTLIVNHTVDPNNWNAFEMISHIYPFLDVVSVREKLSVELLKQHGIQNVLYIPDALWTYKPISNWVPSDALKKEIDFSKPYICLGDSSGIKNAYNSVKWNVSDVLGVIIDELYKVVPQVVFVDGFNGSNEDINRLVHRKKIGRVNFYNCSYHDLFHVLKNASLFISGRWHASILSVLANTPILLWGSDSHKTKSLYPLLDYKYQFFEVSTLPVNIDKLIDTSREILADSKILKNQMRVKSEEFSVAAIENVKLLQKYI